MKRNYLDVKMNGIMTNMVHNVPVLNTIEKSSKQIITLAYSLEWSYRHLKTNSHDFFLKHSLSRGKTMGNRIPVVSPVQNFKHRSF